MKDIKYLICHIDLVDCLGDYVSSLIYHLLFIEWWNDNNKTETNWTLIKINDIEKKLHLKHEDVVNKIKLFIKHNIIQVKVKDKNLYISFNTDDDRIQWCTKYYLKDGELM